MVKSVFFINLKIKRLLVLTPLFGIIIFGSLYFAATFYYPGGSQVDKQSKGFSWLNNYWCNLLNTNAINGKPNTAKPIAITAMLILCISLAVFWYILPRNIQYKKNHRIAIQLSGLLAAITAMFLFTNLHDIIINIACLCAVVAVTGTYAGLYKLKWTKLFWLGIFNLILIALNNILYYGNGLKLYLPVVQKITFLFFLLWICLIDLKFYKTNLKPPHRANEKL